MSAELWIEFTAGRRGAGNIDCIVCGEKIHERVQGSGTWYDGAGDTIGYIFIPASRQPAHEHKPAKEIGPTLGPFEDKYVQITYDSLRHQSEVVAHYDHARGDWIIAEPWTGAGEAYSDITIFAKEV